METHERKTLNLEDIFYDKQGNAMFGYGCLKEPVVCVRPGHKSGLPQIYSEFKNKKIISHNYGHSGIGYTLLFGTVEKAIENFQLMRLEKGISYTDEITVVGLGCVGLITVLTLYFRGFKNIKLIGENFNNTPSFGAGGLIEFSLSTIFKKEQIDYVNQLFKISFSEYQQIFNKQHKFIKYGVKEVDYYTDYYQENAGLSYLANIGMIPKVKKVNLKLGKDSCERELFHFKTFNVATSEFMNSILYTVQRLRIPIEYKKISCFFELKSNIIFNCTGLGSRVLNNDKDCYPICGHGVILSNEDIAAHGYILRLEKVPELNGQDIDGPLYFMPKSSGFIGGTYVKDYDGSNERQNKETINKLLMRSRLVFNGVKPILKPKF